MTPALARASTNKGLLVFSACGDKKKGLLRAIPRNPSIGSEIPSCYSIKNILKSFTQAYGSMHTESVYSLPYISAEPYDLVRVSVETYFAMPEARFLLIS